MVADIGCGCGAFLDLVSGVGQSIIAVEPTESYRQVLNRKGYSTYPYANEALKEWKGKVDIVVSFDVIEHVNAPEQFIREVYELLKNGGKCIIGTPTDAPVMRKLLGEKI